LLEFIENRQSCGEVVRYRVSPHLKFILTESPKKEEKDDKKTQLANIPEKKDDKKDKNKKETIKEKSPSRSKSPAKKVDPSAAAQENLAENNTKEQEEEKRAEMISNLARLRRENYNMICYGLPDIYM